MSLPPLAFARPATIAEATELLTRDGARPLAGGQSLVPALASRKGLRPALLVDLGGLPGLDAIALDPDGRLRIGALVRQRTAERSPLVARHAPLLARALALVGHPSVRNRGTVVGSLTHAEPAAEVPAVAVALDGRVTIRGPGGAEREAPVAELLAGPRRTTLAPGELVTAVRLAPQPLGERHAWLEFAPRRFDLPLVGVAARAAADGGASVTLAGVAPVPRLARIAPAGLRSVAAATAPRALAPSVARIVSALDPPTDARTTGAVRRRLAATLLARALAEVAAHA